MATANDLETVPCDLCGSTKQRFVYKMPDTLYFTKEYFNVVECESCGLAFVNPRPKFEVIYKYYQNDYYNERVASNLAFDLERYKREATYLRFAQCLQNSRPLLLDVGCANGGFARYAQSLGWEVEGVEVASNAEKISDFPVYRCSLPEIPVNSERYDAVTAWAVIEHVHEPMSYFKTVARLLKPEGTFIFLVTNFDSVTSRYLFREDVPRHLYFFSEKTIKQYLDSCGLTLVQVVSDNSMLSLRPVHWLRLFIRRLVGMAPLTWDNLPETRQDYFRRLQREPTLWLNLKYAITHPLTTLDRILMPLFEQVQMARNTYGITTYVARKK